MSGDKVDKEQKYDRQLRLWGADGQAQLESAHICLLTADALGAEMLKNLILPGAGRFTIVDNATVTQLDLGTNFFVEASSEGKNRATEVCRLLQELNPDSTGTALARCPVELVQQELDSFAQYTHVITSNLPDAAVLSLSEFLWSNDIPLVVLKTNGFLGYLRVVKQEHNVIDTRADNAPDDLRVSEPFPDLLEYATKKSLDDMDSNEHSHFPWVLVLVATTAKWRKEHDGKLPTSRDEKKEYKKIVRELARGSEINMTEAFGMAHSGYMPYRLSSDMKEILGHANSAADADVSKIGESARDFWAIARAVRAFVENEGEGKLPVAGGIPDLHSTTDGYLGLQNVYQKKAKEDIAAVTAHLVKLVGQETADKIGADAVTSFCRYGNTLKHLAYRSLKQENDDITTLAPFISNESCDGQWYVLFRAAQCLTGDEKDDDEKFAKLKQACDEVVKKAGGSASPSDGHIKHWIRCDGAQLHNTAAVMGGVASQELIKIITKKYVPVQNTYIWNGLNSTSVTMNL